MKDEKARESASEAEIPPEEEIELLGREMNTFRALKDEREKRIAELRAGEDPAAGVFHHKEIFEMQQDKLRLEVEIELRRKKINRIRLAMDPTGLLH
jgi:hypothetical protein